MTETVAQPLTLTELSYVGPWLPDKNNPQSAALTIIGNNPPQVVDEAARSHRERYAKLVEDAQDNTVNRVWEADVRRQLEATILRHIVVSPDVAILRQPEEDGVLDDYVVQEPVDLTKPNGDEVAMLLAKINVTADPEVSNGLVNHTNARLRQADAQEMLKKLYDEEKLVHDISKSASQLTRRHRIAGAIAGSLLGLLIGFGIGHAVDSFANHRLESGNISKYQRGVFESERNNPAKIIEYSLAGGLILGMLSYMIADCPDNTRMKHAHRAGQRRARQHQ